MAVPDNFNMFQVFNGKVTSLADIQAMRNGDMPPIRDWQETPTLTQRLFSFLPFATVTDTYCKLADLSKWDDDITIQMLIDWGYVGAIVKATQNTFVDTRFDTWVNQAAVADFPLGVYHFSDPAGKPAIEQARYFFNVAQGVPVLSWNDDAEWTGGKSPTALNQWHYDFMMELKVLTPSNQKKGIYTRNEWWKTNLTATPWAAEFDLWCARWAEWLDGPWSDGKYPPRDWTDWVLWQYKSDSMDHNYFHGDLAAMLAYYIEEEEPVSEVTREEFELLSKRVDDLEECLTASEQNITDNTRAIELLRHDFETHEHDTIPNPGPVTAEMIVTDEKTLACKVNGYNNANVPIIYGQFHEPRLRWDFGDHLFVQPDQVTRADGGHEFYTLVPGQNGKNYVPEDVYPLFVLADDLRPA